MSNHVRRTAAERFAQSETRLGRAPTTGVARLWRELRRQRGWSQHVLAESIGVDLSYVSRIECSNRVPSLDLLGRFANSLGLSRAERLQILLALAGEQGFSLDGAGGGRR